MKGANTNVKFNIYDIAAYQVERGSVVSYKIKDGVDANGSSLSGEVATLNDKSVAMTWLNDSLGKRFWLSTKCHVSNF